MKVEQLFFEGDGQTSVINLMVRQLRFIEPKLVEVTAEYRKIAGAKKKECYNNSFRALGANDTYVLGYVLFHGVPIEHAWIKDQSGKHFDVTLIDAKDLAYVSVFEVPQDLLHEYVSKNQHAPSLYDINRFVANKNGK
jgi:hypothetical protein